MTPLHALRRAGRPALLAAVLCAALAAAARGQAVPSDHVLRDFVPNDDYSLWVDLKSVPTAEIYRSDVASAMLILTGALPSPVLVRQGDEPIATVQIMKVSKQKDGSIDLLSDAELATQGPYTFTNGVVSFKVDGHAVELRPRPALLGLHGAAELKAHSPTYVQGEKAYQPNAQAVASLRGTRIPVNVRVFFGSWCPHCRHNVPRILKVEDQVKGSQIHFEYYGLPQQHLAQEPQAKKFKVDGVPIGVVFVNGREVGRLVGDDWKTPEVSLLGEIRKVQGAGKR